MNNTDSNYKRQIYGLVEQRERFHAGIENKLCSSAFYNYTKSQRMLLKTFELYEKNPTDELRDLILNMCQIIKEQQEVLEIIAHTAYDHRVEEGKRNKDVDYLLGQIGEFGKFVDGIIESLGRKNNK